MLQLKVKAGRKFMNLLKTHIDSALGSRWVGDECPCYPSETLLVCGIISMIDVVVDSVAGMIIDDIIN